MVNYECRLGMTTDERTTQERIATMFGRNRNQTTPPQRVWHVGACAVEGLDFVTADYAQRRADELTRSTRVLWTVVRTPGGYAAFRLINPLPADAR